MRIAMYSINQPHSLSQKIVLLLLFLSMVLLFNALLTQKTVAAETETASAKTNDSDNNDDTKDSNKDSKDNKEAADDNDATVGEIAEANIEDSLANIEVIQQTLGALRSEIENSKESTTLNRNNVGTIKEGLKLIEEKLQEAYNNLDESRNSISSNKAMLEEINSKVLELSRSIRTNSSDVGAQKSLIEDNSVRLYEVLVQLSGIEEKFKSISNLLNQKKNEEKESNIILATYDDLHYIWLLFSTVIILSLPLAFTLTHTKIALADHIPQTQGVILIYIAAIIGYFTIGFGLMYGITSSGWLGTSNFLPFDDLAQTSSSNQAGITYLFPIIPFFLYKLGVILLAVLIIYHIIGRQLSSMSHLLLALFVSTLLIPIYSHWIWADQLIESNKGWLAQINFIDQAGAITINSIAAWFAFIIAWKIGSTLPPPEIGQTVDDDEKISYSASTVLLLWLNWISLTTGTASLENHLISNVIINVSLAAAGGAFIAFLHYGFF
ncbi:MAG TPA: hypothetical protein ENK78_03485, partial [Thiothrix sp.]|nr:hypothetical protein [Thiothrix sp.]